MAKASNYPPNDLSRREKTRKEGKCQLCRKKVPLKEQFTVTNDLENNEVKKKKNADRRGAETASHYCGECADKRISQKQAWLNSRDETPKRKKGKAKKAPAKKAKGKAAKKGKGKKVKKVKKVKKTAEAF
jgi:hypothetical protein